MAFQRGVVVLALTGTRPRKVVCLLTGVHSSEGHAPRPMSDFTSRIANNVRVYASQRTPGAEDTDRTLAFERNLNSISTVF